MNYSELEDKAVRKIARIQTEIDAGNEFIMTGNRDVNRRGFIDFFTSKNHVDAPLLSKAMNAVASAENRIRKARLSNLSGSETRKFEKKIFSDLIRSTEVAKSKEIKETADALFKMRNAEKPRDFGSTTGELLNLQKLQLQHRFTDESTAIGLMAGMEKRGYDETELLVLSAISKRTNSRAADVRENLPAALANSEGIKLIKKLESLLDLRSGEIGYNLKSAPNVTEKIHIADLLADVSPTVADLEPIAT